MNATTDKRILFVHMQKTAGSTLREHLINQFGKRAVYPTQGVDGFDPVTLVTSIEYLQKRLRVRGEEVRVIVGHFPLCTADVLGEEMMTLTTLREPVERTLSYLRHHREMTPADSDKTLEEIYDDRERFDTFIQNHMTKMLSLTAGELTDGMLTKVEFTPERLELAKRNLTQIDAFGMQEHYDEFHAELRDRFGWDLGPKLVTNTTKPVEVSAAFRERIAADNLMDTELYEYACKLKGVEPADPSQAAIPRLNSRRSPMTTDDAPPYLDEDDPDHWGYSLANLAELLRGCLDASGSRSVAEVGAFAGNLTRLLLEWAEGIDGRVVAIDPTPEPSLVELADANPKLELIQKPSFEALAEIELPDAIVIDGDHNYYTVSGELGAIGERAPGTEFPLLLLHDLGWPHARRDAYWDPEAIPSSQRRPMADHAQLFPGNPGFVSEGLPMHATALQEGGAANGVLTAVEDFLEGRRNLELALIPAFFGFGVIWHREAPWAGAIRELTAPWDRNPLLQRLEQNRLLHLASSNARAVELKRATQGSPGSGTSTGLSVGQRDEINRLRSLSDRQGKVLRSLLASGGLRVADSVSSLRHPGRDWSWRDRVLDVIGDEDNSAASVRAASAAGTPQVEWISEERCRIGGLTFQTAPPDMFEREDGISMEDADFFLFKSKVQIDRYLRLFAELKPRRLAELGIYFGGSVAFFFELADPERLVAIDLDEGKAPVLTNYVRRRGIEDRLRVREGVDQSDRQLLRRIVADDLGAEPLDLVIDDCSHLYEPTRASFNELFPRLRPGGVYVIEDWPWLYDGGPEGADVPPAPLSRMIGELMLAVATVPLFISEVTIEQNAVFVRRGPEKNAPMDFDIATATKPEARRLLGAD